MNIALYCRVSTDEQAKRGESIADQEQALIRFAESRQATYTVFKDEGYSAHRSYKSRPALSLLLEKVNEFDLVCFTKLDRWTRKTSDYYKLEECLGSVPWRAILENYETETADGRLRVGIMLSVNQHEAERTSERIKFTFAEKKKRGELVSGNLPRGYKIENGKPVKNEDAAAVQAFWDTYFLRGFGESQKAAREHGLLIEGSSAAYMLRHAESYAGTIQGIECEPYITKEQAERIAKSRKSRPKKSQRVFLFSGIVFCGECGHRFSGHVNHYKKKDGEIGEQVFYNCSYRHKIKPYGCKNHTCILESKIEKHLLAELSAVLADYNAKVVNYSPKKQNDVAERLRALEQKKKRAYEVYIDGLVSREDFEKQIAKIEDDIKAVDVPETKKAPVQLPKDWQEAYKGASDEGKREFWQSIIKEIRINSDRTIEIVPL